MRIYDVSVPISGKTPVYEGDPKVEITSAHTIKDGAPANVSNLCFGAHTATHVDAPNHFIEGSRKVDELSLDVLIGKVRVVEIDKKAAAVDAAHLENVDLKGVERILFKTRNSEFWNDLSQGFRKDFTYIAPDAAHKL
ncbi:MAG: cyclase family protein, partial [Acidobacteriota bacterium]|nr:cyclase family protein [Acidobacteriota bacterium]